MNRSLVRMYPKRWRDEYGSEFAAMLEETPTTPAAVVDVVRGAAVAHGRQRSPSCTWLLAVLMTSVGVSRALSTGITRNVLWAPTTFTRASHLVVTFLPIVWASASTWRRRAHG